MRRNLWSSATTGNLISPLTGNSLGGNITLTYDYKVAQWDSAGNNNVPQASPWGNFVVQYGATATGPWTTVATVLDTDDVQTGSCINKSVVFTPPAGPLFIRFSATWATGSGADYYLNFDTVTATETQPPCSGAPTPGNTVGPAGAVCAGNSFTLSLQNTIPGTGVSYQWNYGPSNVGPWLPLGTGATQVATQTLDTWYYCDVTCGSSTVGSTPIQVTTVPAGASFPEGFEGGVINPGCWSVNGGVLPVLGTASAFGTGSASAKFDFWAWGAGSSAQLISPILAPTVAGDQIYFDVAGALWSGGLSNIDQVTLEASSDGGANWNSVVVMNNSLSGVLNTAPAGGLFTPTATQWASLAYPLAAGTNRVRFVSLAGFGNNVYLDNVSVGVLPSARHTAYGRGCGTAPVMSLSAAPAPVSTGVSGTTVVYTIDNIPLACPSPAPAFNFGIVMISLGQDFAGTELPSLGVASPGCNLHITSLDVTLGYVGSTASQTVNFDVPAAVSGGFLFYAQAAALICPASPNDAGVLLSNGVRSYVNNF